MNSLMATQKDAIKEKTEQCQALIQKVDDLNLQLRAKSSEISALKFENSELRDEVNKNIKYNIHPIRKINKNNGFIYLNFFNYQVENLKNELFLKKNSVKQYSNKLEDELKMKGKYFIENNIIRLY